MQECILILAKNIAHAAVVDRAMGNSPSVTDDRIADAIRSGMNNMPCPTMLRPFDHWTNLHAAAQQVASASARVLGY